MIANRKYTVVIPSVSWLYSLVLGIFFICATFFLAEHFSSEDTFLYVLVCVILVFSQFGIIQDVTRKSFSQDLIDKLICLRVSQTQISLIKALAVAPITIPFAIYLCVVSLQFGQPVLVSTLVAVSVFVLASGLFTRPSKVKVAPALSLGLVGRSTQNRYFALLGKDVSEMGIVPFVLLLLVSFIFFLAGAILESMGFPLIYPISILLMYMIVSEFFSREDTEHNMFFLKYYKVDINEYAKLKMKTFMLFALVALVTYWLVHGIWGSFSLNVLVGSLVFFLYCALTAYSFCFLYLTSLNIRARFPKVFDALLFLLNLIPFVVIVMGYIARRKIRDNRYFWSYYA